LSHGMQNLSFRYTRWINRREKRAGHLFQGRYKAVLVDGDSYLLELVRYIHLNPVRCGMVNDPEEYPWSSHKAYLGKEFLSWLTTDWLLGHFGKSLAKARSGYRAFVMDGLGEEYRPEFHGGQEDPRLLGDDGFVDKCLSSTGKVPLRLSLQQIVDKVCGSYQINEATLKTKSQQRVASEARAVIGWLARELGYSTLSDVGKRINRDVRSISSSVRRLSYRMREEAELAERVRLLQAEFEEAS